MLLKIHLIIPLLSLVIDTNKKLPIKIKDANPSTNALKLSSTKLPTIKENMVFCQYKYYTQLEGLKAYHQIQENVPILN